MERARILILTASIGSGHLRAAEAIRAALASHPQAEAMQVDVVDFMAREVSAVHYLMKRIYLMMLRFVPDLYDVFFRIAGKKTSGGIVRGVFAQVMVRTMGRIIRAYAPDLVIATHPFPEGAAALWRMRHGSSFSLAALMTDYALHTMWLVQGVDIYFVATESMAAEMAARGFAPQTVHATGIPITCADDGLTRRTARSRSGFLRICRLSCSWAEDWGLVALIGHSRQWRRWSGGFPSSSQRDTMLHLRCTRVVWRRHQGMICTSFPIRMRFPHSCEQQISSSRSREG